MRILFALAASLMLTSCWGGTTEGNVAVADPVTNVTTPQGTNWLETVSRTPEGGYRQGNPAAPIKLVEYGSRSCPVCGRFAAEGMEPLRAKYISTGKVSYEFRDFFVHPQDPAIAVLGHCVPTEAFFPILDGMFAEQPRFAERQSQVTDEMFQQIQGLPRQQQTAMLAQVLGYVDFMKQRGIPQARLDQCLADPAMLATLGTQVQTAIDRGVAGTPSFFINDQKVNAVVWADLEPQLQAAGAR